MFGTQSQMRIVFFPRCFFFHAGSNCEYFLCMFHISGHFLKNNIKVHIIPKSCILHRMQSFFMQNKHFLKKWNTTFCRKSIFVANFVVMGFMVQWLHCSTAAKYLLMTQVRSYVGGSFSLPWSACWRAMCRLHN